MTTRGFCPTVAGSFIPNSGALSHIGRELCPDSRKASLPQADEVYTGTPLETSLYERLYTPI
jgi:hypothetical protein